MPDSDLKHPGQPIDPEGDSPIPPESPGGENAGGGVLRSLRTMLGWKPVSLRSNLQDVLEGSAGKTDFSPRESVMLQNILGLHERRVQDVMVPRADIIAVQQDLALGQLMKVFANAGHSRLVVYDDTLDDAVGMVHIRDLVAFMTKSAETGASGGGTLPAALNLAAVDLTMPLSAAKLIREILFAPPSMPVSDLMARMQASRIHLALVVDEYGGADGVVSIEDIVEEIVGEIADEHDEDVNPQVVRQSDGSFLADGRASLEDVTRIIGAEFDVGEIANEVDTLGGYIATRIGRVPLRGELVPGPGRFEIEVLDADPRRVKKLKVYLAMERSNGRGPPSARMSASSVKSGSTEISES
jgi:CBS domain containing-hemolysin-like protein